MVTIYSKFVQLESSKLHAKFQDHRTFASGEEYGHGSHLGHVIKTIFTKFMFSLPMKAPHKIWL